MKRLYQFAILFLCCILLMGCESAGGTGDATEVSSSERITATQTPTLLPPTATASPTLAPTPTATPTPTITPSPTATPFLRDGPEISESNFSKLQKFATLGKGSVRSAVLSQDGKVYIIKSAPGITLYDAETLAQIAFFAEFGDFYLIPDKTDMIAITPQLRLAVIDLHSASIIVELQPAEAFGVLGVVFSPDASRMAVAMSQPHATRQNFTSYRVDVWDIENYSLVSRLESDLLGMSMVMAISPDNSQLLTLNFPLGGGLLKTARWDIPGAALTWYLSDAGQFNAQPFSQDGSLFATHPSTNSRSIIIRRTLDGAEVGRVTGSVGGNPFSPDNMQIVTSSHQEIYVWNVLSSQRVKRIQTDLDWPLASFSEDGKHILANYGAQAWRCVDFTEDSDYPKPEVEIPLLRPLADWRAQGHVDGILGVELIQGDRLLVWGSTSGESNLQEKILWWWFPEMEIYEEVSLGIAPGQPALSPAGDEFAVCTGEGLWLVEIEGNQVESVGPCRSSSSAVVYSGDGLKLYISSGIVIDEFDINNRTILSQLRGHQFNVGSLSLSQDGKLMFSRSAAEVRGGWESIIWTLDPNSFVMKWNITAKPWSAPLDAVFSPDSSMFMAVFGREVFVWRIKDGWYLANIDGVTVELSPKGDLAVIGTEDLALDFYDPANWERLGSLPVSVQPQGYDPFTQYGPQKRLTNLKFLDEGRVLVSVMSDGVIDFWYVP